MDHIKNIARLFNSSAVESPLLETFDAGVLELTSGRLVASDPLTTPDILPFTTLFPTGQFKTLIHRERESSCVAYAEIVFGDEKIERWEMALTDGQDLTQLQGEEIYGYPVESGMGCLMDAVVQADLQRLEQEIYEKKGDDFMGIYEEFFHPHFFHEDGAVDQFALLKPYVEKAGNLLAFEAGYGEGFYASYIGFAKDGRPMKLVTEFIEIL